MKRFLIVICLVAMVASCTKPDAWLKVVENHFVGADGEKVVLRGLCFSDPVKLYREGHWNDTYWEEAARWGANIVRFAVHPENINSLGWDETFAILDEGVAQARKHGLLVIMDWHSIGNLVIEQFAREMYITTKAETFRFWRTVAQRYKDEPTVAMYELFNEPTLMDDSTSVTTWAEWKELQEQIIDTIRTYNPHALCLCAGFDWAYDLTPIVKEPVRRENIAYVSHPYPQKRGQPWEEQWEKDFGYVADTYPVICTEIGFCLPDERGAHNPVMASVEYGERITKYFEKKGISFTVWCFDPHWAPMLFSDWNFTPTTQGRFFKSYLQQNKK
ncbi:MAG: cellulase family glycosylhydrolase [Bacteroidaceae bacterium]|nr:cellulase family glycosylhydrolase [Bacteroidaceae bacterium]